MSDGRGGTEGAVRGTVGGVPRSRVPHLGCRAAQCFLTRPEYAIRGTTDTLIEGRLNGGGARAFVCLERLEILLVVSES